MNELLKNIANVLLLSLIFAYFGIKLDNWLAKEGIVRKKTITIILVVAVSAIFQIAYYEKISLWTFSGLLLLFITLGVHRIDLYNAQKNGRWWWQEERNEN